MPRWSPHPVTLRQLQYALAVAEFGNFRKAAEACAIAQPSLSSQIAQLESALGVQLFERLTRGVVVTDAGHAILERAQRLIVAADDLVATADRARDPDAGTLHIGVIPTVAPYLLPDIAPALRARFPRVRFFWEEEKTQTLVERLESGSLDAGILALESDMNELAYAELGRDAFFLAVPADHKLARTQSPARLEHLHGETVLVLADGHCFRDQALEVCHRAGADEASVRATSLSTLAQMVASGTGITLLPRIALATENRARSLVTRPFGARGPARTLVLAWRKTTPIAASLKGVAEVVRETIAPLVA
ncbi:MAG TPA: LysR substrate-binding domain-containing protein [Polyangiaceae bacterium]|jgi:LysR family hydrogen peroxide-inducible transcriptional activator|nr:LysR substrate-binding domain-containing protein [Polyangiaceae bacterium]